MSRFTAAFFALFFATFSVAPAALAEPATAEAILKAVADADKYSICTDNTTRLGDCIKTTTRCDLTTTGWRNYVSNRYENVGGTVVARSGFEGPYAALDYLRADWARNSVTPPGPIQKGSCYCSCGRDDNLEACRGKQEGFPVQRGEDLTYEECTATCSPRDVAVTKCAIAPVTPVSLAAPVTTASTFASDAFCFTAGECAEQNGYYEEHEDCRGKGRCYASEPPVRLQVPLGEVTEVRGLSRYVVAAYRYGISIVAVAATVMLVYGAFLFLVGSALTSVSQGKQIMIDAILGMIFVFAATMILRTLNPATTQLDPIRVYLVNTRQFVTAALCKELGSQTRVERAGVKPSLVPFDTVAARDNAFGTLVSATDCGVTYWVEGTSGSSCEGTRCPEPNQTCQSCSDPDTLGCDGIANDRRICVHTVFGGTIDFVEGKYPIGVRLVAFCNYAQNENPESITDSIELVTRTAPSRVGRRAGTVTTNEDDAGRASYLFELEESDIAEADAACADGGGGLRGFVLAVAYKEPYSASGLTVDDVAVLSRGNCRAGRFDGYADGTSISATDPTGIGAATGFTLPRREDIASAIACGVRQGKFQTTPGTFWSAQDLYDAVAGRAPITCDFTLSAQSAPNDPAGTFCQQ